jgi:hypothetical protein
VHLDLHVIQIIHFKTCLLKVAHDGHYLEAVETDAGRAAAAPSAGFTNLQSVRANHKIDAKWSTRRMP